MAGGASSVRVLAGAGLARRALPPAQLRESSYVSSSMLMVHICMDVNIEILRLKVMLRSFLDYFRYIGDHSFNEWQYPAHIDS